MNAKSVGGNGWEVTDESGARFYITRITVTGQEGSYCRCGGVWEARARSNRPCAHIRAVEDAVAAYWRAHEQASLLAWARGRVAESGAEPVIDPFAEEEG